MLKLKMHSRIHCCVAHRFLTWCNKAVLWFFFDLKRLLFALALVLVAVGTWRSALRCEGSMDTVCRQVTLLQQQVHRLRETVDSLSISGQLGGS